MRKIAIVVTALMLSASVAQAQYSHNRHHYQHQQHRPQQHHQRHNWLAPAIGLGILGGLAGTMYYNYNTPPRCWNEWYIDQYGRQIVNKVCEQF
jgi:H+/Cl- antiporter ClcA